MVNYSDDMLIAKVRSGSHAYGTNIETSDIDHRGIFVASKESIRTPFYPVYVQNDNREQDTQYFELNHFMKLALECNPNILELLWTADEDIILDTFGYKLLREHAPQLLSQRVAFTYVGYGMSQLKRMKGHSKWINNPMPQTRPRQIDFITLIHNFSSQKMLKLDLTKYKDGYKLVPYHADVFGLYVDVNSQTFVDTDGSLIFEHVENVEHYGTPVAVIKFNRAEYNTYKDNWTNYWTWKNNRNEVRNALEDQFGFDTKNAMHLVRLLRQGVEILQTGKLLVRRPDAAELLSIRNGAWSYDQLLAYAELMENKIKTIQTTSMLPKTPNIELATELILTIQDSMWNKKEGHQ